MFLKEFSPLCFADLPPRQLIQTLTYSLDQLPGGQVSCWLEQLDIQTLVYRTMNSWENGYNESLNGKLRNESLNGKTFAILLGAQVLIDDWRKEYNQLRSHSSQGCRPSAIQQPVKVKVLTLESVTTNRGSSLSPCDLKSRQKH